MERISEEIEGLAHRTIGAAIEVHKHLGPGYLEKIYQRAMQHELREVGLPFCAQQPVDIDYKGIDVGRGRVDFLVDRQLIVELKAVKEIQPIHRAQVIQYLKATGLPLALMLNFKVKRMKDGLKRMVLTEQAELSAPHRAHRR